ncbi:hypothetical protein COHA_009117 [Chlorella ohadii]|uniref:Uncharacterized protein n=1 Tax=Chlorella ohadii TaxID=2649997 RepID=A0AAD5DFE9_9CHLO|nr:hypothetical protein COHA_009117 [Chlorella ohadii]
MRRRAQLPLLGLLVAALAAPAAAQAAETVSMDSCQDALWSGLPLAKQQTPSDSYNPTSYDYYHDWVLKHVLPPFVFSCITAALLLAFALWRAIKLCRCVRCIRGPQRRARAAADTLGARRHRILQAGVCVLACGVVAGAGYGLSTIQPELQPRGVGVFEQAKAYVADGLATANATIGSVATAEADVADVRQRVEDLNLEQLQPGTLALIGGFQSDLGSVLAGMRSATADIQRLVLDKMQQLQEDWQPRLDKLDVAKNALLYAAYAFIIAAAVGVGLAVALNCPSVASSSLFILLVMLVIAWAAVWASTAGLKVGSDGCAVVEQKIIGGLMDAAEEQVASGTGLLSTVGVGDTLALARYYLWGTGRDPTEILADLTGWNVWDLINEANVTVSGLRSATYLVQGINSSIATLPNNLETLSDDIEAVAANVSLLEAALSHERFHPVYLSAKQYACCDVLNWLGGLWLGLLIVGCAGVPMTLLAFWWLGRMDKLEPHG